MSLSLSQGRNFVTASAFALALFACALGLAMCFVKSPQAKAHDLMTIAVQQSTHDLDLARSYAFEAARLDPSSPQVWGVLATILQQKGETSIARQAAQIATTLHSGGDFAPVLYAMPAELRLSLLAGQAGTF